MAQLPFLQDNLLECPITCKLDRYNQLLLLSLADGQVPGGVGTSQKQEMRLKDDWKEGWMCDVLLLD